MMDYYILSRIFHQFTFNTNFPEHVLNISVKQLLINWLDCLYEKYIIKIFQGGDPGDDTFKPPPPYKQLLPLPTPCFEVFWRDSLMTPIPTTPLQASVFTATPSTSTMAFPHPQKNDHTHASSVIHMSQALYFSV